MKPTATMGLLLGLCPDPFTDGKPPRNNGFVPFRHGTAGHSHAVGGQRSGGRSRPPAAPGRLSSGGRTGEMPMVEVVDWPSGEHRRVRLADAGRPRLLLVSASAPPPVCLDPLEDWVRLPAADGDIEARLGTLGRRAVTMAPTRPTIDADGVVRFGDGWVALPPVEARVVAALIDRLDTVVSRAQLAAAGWPEGAPGRNALDVHVLRLRRRIAPLGLAIRTIRSRGYLLERVEAQARQG